MKNHEWRLFGGEFSQAIFRFSCACLVWAYAALAVHFNWNEKPAYGLIGIYAYLAFSAAWIFMVRFSILKKSHRRVTATILDQLIPAAGFYIGGALLAAVVWTPGIAAVGVGLRFGARYTWLSSAIALPALGYVVLLSPSWQGKTDFALTVLAMTIFFPLYAVTLAERLRSHIKEIKSKAVHFENEARLDPLTGIQNRTGLIDIFLRKGSWESTGVSSFSLINLDLDGFKAINDLHGHAKGDEVLKIVAQTIKSCLRSPDVVARLGGDEFGIYLAEISTAKDAEAIVHHVLTAIRHIDIDGSDLRLGASAGICVLPHSLLPTIHDAFLAADRLMYEAKRGGKNQFRTFQPEPACC